MTDYGVPTLLELLRPNEVEQLQSLGCLRKFRDGETVQERGDQGRVFQIVSSGSIRLMRLDSDGRELAVTTINQGQNFGDPIHAGGGAKILRAVARGDTEILQFSDAAYEQLLANPAIVRALYLIAQFRLDLAIDMINDERTLPVEVRLAKLLQSMHKVRVGPAQINCIQEELARLTGVSSVTIGKALAFLRAEGLIDSGYRQVTIRDVPRLKKWITENSGD